MKSWYLRDDTASTESLASNENLPLYHLKLLLDLQQSISTIYAWNIETMEK